MIESPDSRADSRNKVSGSALEAVFRGARGGLLPPDGLVVSGRQLRSPEEPVPLYGDATTTRWNVNVLGRPPGRTRSWGMIDFGHLDGEWLTTGKDLALVLLNPQHASLVERAVPIRQSPASPGTVRLHVRALRDYFDIGRWNGFPTLLADWDPELFADAFKRIDERDDLSEQRVRHLERVPRLLYGLRDIIANAPSINPWPTVSGSPFEGRFTKRDLRTDPVDPDIYFPLLDAAMAYVDVFSVDIIHALDKLDAADRLREEVQSKDLANAIDDYLRDFRNPIPVHRMCSVTATDSEWHTAINWQLLTRLATGRRNGVFSHDSRPPSLERRRLSIEAARSGRALVGGTTVPQARLQGMAEPWVIGLGPTELQNEVRFLRTASYIVIASLTMMRDSEIQAIERACLTTYYGSPALKSSIIKSQPGRPIAHWWITEPVRRAIEVMERTSNHPTMLFASSRDTKGTDVGGFSIYTALSKFRSRVNASTERTGLAPIAEGDVAPHMLRRTMALITEWERGGQIAASHQLKHASLVSRSNSLTGAYSAPTERWAEELRERQAHHNAQFAVDSLALAPLSKPIGPGAARARRALSPPGVVLGPRARARLLSQQFPDMRVGTANICLGDSAVAECLTPEERESAHPVRPTLCDPTRCANSVILPIQEALWRSEEQSLLSIRATPRLSKHARAMVDERLAEVRRVTWEAP